MHKIVCDDEKRVPKIVGTGLRAGTFFKYKSTSSARQGRRPHGFLNERTVQKVRNCVNCYTRREIKIVDKVFSAVLAWGTVYIIYAVNDHDIALL